MLYETVERVFDAKIRIELADRRSDSAFAYLERGARRRVGSRRAPRARYMGARP